MGSPAQEASASALPELPQKQGPQGQAQACTPRRLRPYRSEGPPTQVPEHWMTLAWRAQGQQELLGELVRRRPSPNRLGGLPAQRPARKQHQGLA